MPLHPDDLETPPDASVSCLMVVSGEDVRVERLQRAINGFRHQTLPRKRLVIVLSGVAADTADAIRRHIAGLKRRDIRLLTPAGRRTSGQLRAIGLEAATGELICLWGDDGRHHPERLARQAAVLIGTDLEAAYLQEAMHWAPSALTCGTWRTAPVPGHPGTLMARRSAQLRFPAQDDQPDTGLAEALMARGRVGFITGAPHLYVGENDAPTLPFGGQPMAQDMLMQREALIRAGLEVYEFAPGTPVHGDHGEAFRL